MKFKGFSPLGVKIKQFLFMKRLTYIKHFFQQYRTQQVLQEKEINPLHHDHLIILLQSQVNIKYSFQWYQIRYTLQEKQNHPLHHGHVANSMDVNSTKKDKYQLWIQLQTLTSINFFFPMVYYTIGFTKKTKSPITMST